ncbi:glucans biosynthesis glucosyltransferase MdoH [Azospirillum argentinense]|uniref:Glucans biosynthesis glucosyltransferase H n=1 Tax=Azospirillum argentinense TaxID=2970906 RepID=A0A5B0KTR5_9PROT|nr:glucans biosynthesis glucosyltransferase MdoH [Azospirillum argentinense]KAA1054234.1 Glucans biosynthesis glucosyltransferase H [Azospirillum argentinense]
MDPGLKIAAMTSRAETARIRRTLYVSAVLGSTLAASWLMLEVLRANGLNVLEVTVLALFTLSFAWIATSFWTATAGFLVRLIGRDPAGLAVDDSIPLVARTAIVMPIYNEEPERVCAGLAGTWRSLAATGEAGMFDMFVLSDTRDPTSAEAERRAIERLVGRLGAAGRIFYRRRAHNTGRKAGNIADFVTRWGGTYDHTLVLDADSVMAGRTIVRLSRLMQAHPDAGIIQTLPLPANAETLFGRMLQFASRLYGPVLASGLAWWQLGDGNYWGHNAIIRTKAFAAHCGLPQLPGREPLGGEILSHDFVEAALIRRAGWGVWIVPDLEGSWEELPPNAIDYATRDRRWCQGNLQHMALLGARGLHPMSRLHLTLGVMSYVASPLWLILLLLATVDVLSLAAYGHPYFLPGHNLFPNWPVSKPDEVASLLTVTALALLVPRLYSLLLALSDADARRGFGGVGRLLASAAVELVHSMLLAPAMMLFHTQFIAATLLGRKVGWSAQRRVGRSLTAAEAVRRHGAHTLLGLGWGGLVLAMAPDFAWWLLPVLTGLVVSVGLSMITSRLDVGAWFRRYGLLVTPEEVLPPFELRMVRWDASSAASAGIAPEVSSQQPVSTSPEPRPLMMPVQNLEWWSPRGLPWPSAERLPTVLTVILGLFGSR